MHVSSAYVNSYLLEVSEKLYPSPDEAERIIELTKTLKDDALKELEPSILKEHPNTYTFTKHLAEHEVNKCAGVIPCGIVRPSMSEIFVDYFVASNYILFFYFSYRCLEGASTWLDDFQEWPSGVLHGCFQGGDPPFAIRP